MLYIITFSTISCIGLHSSAHRTLRSLLHTLSYLYSHASVHIPKARHTLKLTKVNYDINSHAHGSRQYSLRERAKTKGSALN